MKLNYKTLASILLSGSLLFTGCTKEDSVFTDGGSSGIVELDLPARTTSTIYSFAAKAFDIKDEVDFPVTVNYTGVAGAPADVQVTLALDADAVVKYNAAASKNFESLTLSPALFSVPNYTVTIPKGQKKASFIIKLKTRNFDLKKLYAVGVSIKSVSSGIISGNYGTGIYQISAKNKYDGVYKVTNLEFRNVNNATHTALSPRTRYLITSGEFEDTLYDPAGNYGVYFLNGTTTSYYGNFAPIFTFDGATDRVTAATNYYPSPNSSNRSAALDLTGVNKITISGDSKVLEVSYILVENGVNTVYLKEKWEYTGPRP